jgi:hypothetical protein
MNTCPGISLPVMRRSGIIILFKNRWTGGEREAMIVR